MIDITGKSFGKLTVIGPHHKNSRGEWTWLCKCECGKETVSTGYRLRSGRTKSCGCIQAENRKNGFHSTHRMTNTKIYTIWCNMKARCGNKNNISYPYYGGRGISVCEEWLSFDGFYAWAVGAGYVDGLSIDRIDVNGNYCPQNCRWVEPKKQWLNRSDSHAITAFGKTQTIKEWAEESGIKYDTIERRINAYGWTAEKAVSVKPNR